VTKTIITCFLTLACAFLIGGCANNPTVHLYGKYLEESKLQALTEKFKEQGLNVDANEFDFPTAVNSNTLLYSLLLRSPDVIDKAASIAELEGFPITNMQALTQGNHWYTKDSLALFLFPDGRKPNYSYFQMAENPRVRFSPKTSQIHTKERIAEMANA
jgi:hypothetical protein